MCALYYKYKYEIKVWLFAKGMLLWWITEDEMDRNKPFDAFISYAEKDKIFVENILIENLEKEPYPYRLCFHHRNWIPGEFISTQITTSVEQSKRTIIILSKNFLESLWGRMEFRTAHTAAMKEKRVRVIVVIYGDIDLNGDLDVELKAYLKTNTYVKADDPWFWEKLMYALPHANCRERLQSKKLSNVIAKIEKANLNLGSKVNDTECHLNLDPLVIKQSP